MASMYGTARRKRNAQPGKLISDWISVAGLLCSMEKHSRHPFSKQGMRSDGILDLVHSDICGPMEVASFGGSRYFIVFMDDKSRRMCTYCLKIKSQGEITNIFKEFHAMVERQSGRKLKVLRTDNGRENTSTMDSKGIY